MSKKRVPQKLVTFTDNEADISKIEQEISNGWNIISLVAAGTHYVGIMEMMNSLNEKDNSILYIPPRKKIKFTN